MPSAPERFSSGMLQQLSPQKLHLLLGEMTSLLMLSSVHRQYQIRDIPDLILPAVNLNQYMIFRDANHRPIAFVTWGKFSAEVEQAYRKGKVHLSEQELTSGSILYFMDFVAPYGHAKQVIRQLCSTRFAQDCAYSLRFYADRTKPPKWMRFYGTEYKKSVH